jgi:hypothetical protein
MYDFKLSDQFLSDSEQEVFKEFLSFNSLDESVWGVLGSLFNSGTKYTKPLTLKIYKDSQLVGVVIIVKCSKYGRSLFNNKLLAKTNDLLKIPFNLWIKLGCCMDMMSNPGFVKDPLKVDEVLTEAIEYLRKNSLLTIVNDYSKNSGLYKKASILPALPHGLIDVSSMSSLEDYTSNYKNIRRKVKTFAKKGGEYVEINRMLDKKLIDSLKKCFITTAEKSVFYLPYQDLYLKAAINTGLTEIDNVYYFVAYLNNEFIGYQAAVMTGDHLKALHGAFNRNLKTTYHAYDILFVKMTEFAINHGLKYVDFGAIANLTKQKMVNDSIEMSYFIMSKYSAVQKLFNMVLKVTKVQGSDQLKFRN